MEHDEKQKVEAEIAALQWDLSSHASADKGDFHPIKMMDAILKSDKFWELFAGVELPYSRADVNEFLAKREATRAKIRELKKQLEN